MINGNQLRDAYISAANHIMARRQEVDALNVFPVPDGDTGTNMSLTMKSTVKEIAAVDEHDASKLLSMAVAANLIFHRLQCRLFQRRQER